MAHNSQNDKYIGPTQNNPNLIKDGTFEGFTPEVLNRADHIESEGQPLYDSSWNGANGEDMAWSSLWRITGSRNHKTKGYADAGTTYGCELLGAAWWKVVTKVGKPGPNVNGKRSQLPYAINLNGRQARHGEIGQTIELTHHGLADLNINFLSVKHSEAPLSYVAYYDVILRKGGADADENEDVDNPLHKLHFIDGPDFNWKRQSGDFKNVPPGTYTLILKGVTGFSVGSFVADIVLCYRTKPEIKNGDWSPLLGSDIEHLKLTTKVNKAFPEFYFKVTQNGQPVDDYAVEFEIKHSSSSGIHFTDTGHKKTATTDSDGKVVINNLIAGNIAKNNIDILQATIGGQVIHVHLSVEKENKPKPDQWTISGTVPAVVAQPTTVSLQLLKNGVPAAAGEQVDISLNPQTYLKVQPNPVRTDATGTLHLTLTPVSPQTGSHTTTLGLSHGGKLLASYPVTTSGSSVPVPTAKYEIRVYDEADDTKPLDLTQPHIWPEGEGNYVYLSVVRRGTSEEVDTARITVTLSPEGVFRPATTTATFTRGQRARFDFSPVGSNRNSVRITFTSPEAGDAVLNIRQGKAGGKLEVVKGNPLQLMSGLERTPKGEDAVLDVRFNPPYTGGTPPPVSFRINGHGFYVYVAGTPVTAGSLTPEDPDGDGSYRIQPQLKTDASASHSGSITFFIDKAHYPEAAATYAEVTVPVSFSRVHHVQWSVKDRTVVDAGSTTLLKPALKAFDVNDKELSAYVLDVRIVATGSAGASFVTGDAQSHRLIGKAGWTPLPELHIKQNTGQFQLQASLEGAGTPLETKLTLLVQAPQPASEIIMHPEQPPEITWSDIDGNYTRNASQYAELRDAGHHAVHSGKVKFVINASNTAKATMTHPDNAANPHVKTVAVNANGRALWPDITLGNTTGTFTLTASSDGVQDAKTVTFKVS